METINDLIRKRYNKLTKGKKAVAEFVQEQPQQVALLTAKQIGALTGTSETTVIRFSLEMGFTGFGMLQEEIRKSLIAPKKYDNPLRKIGDLEHNGKEVDLTRFIVEQDITYMNKTVDEIEPEQLARAIDSIIAAKKIVVVGLRATHTAAYWLAYTLNIVRGNTTLYRGGIDDANYIISDLVEDCLVIALSFPRYMTETVQFVESAMRRSAKILTISDNELSPLGGKSDIFLKINAPQPVTLKGMTVLFSLLNILVGCLIDKDQKNIQHRLDSYNDMNEQFLL